MPSNTNRLFVLILLGVNALLFSSEQANATQLDSRHFNMNFEEFDDNNNLTYWQIVGDQQEETLDKKTKLFGEQALLLSTIHSKSNSPQSFFGQTIYAEFDRETITLVGYVKYQNYSAAGQFFLYLTTYEGSEERGETKYIEHKLRNSQDWQKLTITLPIDKSVLYANIGGVLLGKGRVWVDQMHLDFSFNNKTTKSVPSVQFKQNLAVPRTALPHNLNGSLHKINQKISNNLDRRTNKLKQ